MKPIRTAAGLSVCLMMSLLVGCAQQQSLVRGQSPVYTGGTVEQTYPFPYNLPHAKYAKKDVEKEVSEDYSFTYKNGELPTWNGEAWVYQDGTPYYGWAPTHYYSFNYKVPDNLVYPNPMPTPAGLVMYPYYTHKGPDCFFHQ